MEMPIGCHRGQPVAALPTKYLAWLVSQDAIRFKRWPLVQEALRVLRSRFENFDAMEAELRVDIPPPEYWKTAKRAGRKNAERAEATNRTCAAPATAGQLLDAAAFVRAARLADFNGTSDLL